jgi:hypothetical protein
MNADKPVTLCPKCGRELWGLTGSGCCAGCGAVLRAPEVRIVFWYQDLRSHALPLDVVADGRLVVGAYECLDLLQPELYSRITEGREPVAVSIEAVGWTGHPDSRPCWGVHIHSGPGWSFPNRPGSRDWITRSKPLGRVPMPWD